MQRDHHGIGRRALDGPFPLGDLLAEDGLPQREDCAAALRSWLGATTLIVPSPATPSTRARKPSA